MAKQTTEIIIIQGPTASGKSLIAGLLLEYYEKLDGKALVFDNYDDTGNQIQKIFESNHFDYILVTFQDGEGIGAPCLEKPWKTITIN